jgi:hypothetical protein
VRKARHRLGLSPQPYATITDLQQRVQELDRDASVELGIVRRIDGTHAAVAQRIEDHVTPDVGAPRKQLLEGHHRGGGDFAWFERYRRERIRR